MNWWMLVMALQGVGHHTGIMVFNTTLGGGVLIITYLVLTPYHKS